MKYLVHDQHDGHDGYEVTLQLGYFAYVCN